MPSFSKFYRSLDDDESNRIRSLREDDSHVEMDDESSDALNEDQPVELQLQQDNDDSDPLSMHSEVDQFDEVNELEEIDIRDEIEQRQETKLWSTLDRVEDKEKLRKVELNDYLAAQVDELLDRIGLTADIQPVDRFIEPFDPLNESLLDVIFEQPYQDLDFI